MLVQIGTFDSIARRRKDDNSDQPELGLRVRHVVRLRHGDRLKEQDSNPLSRSQRSLLHFTAINHPGDILQGQRRLGDIG